MKMVKSSRNGGESVKQKHRVREIATASLLVFTLALGAVFSDVANIAWAYTNESKTVTDTSSDESLSESENDQETDTTNLNDNGESMQNANDNEESDVSTQSYDQSSTSTSDEQKSESLSNDSEKPSNLTNDYRPVDSLAGDNTQTGMLNDLLKSTVISRDESTALSQLENLIPDLTFRKCVYWALVVEDQLGDPDDPDFAGLNGEELYKAVLMKFDGNVYAKGNSDDDMGYVKGVTYAYSLILEDASSDTGTRTYEADNLSTYDEAYSAIQSIINSNSTQPVIDQKISASYVTSEGERPTRDKIKDISGIVWLRRASEVDLRDNTISSLYPIAQDNVEVLARQYDPNCIEQLLDGSGIIVMWFGNRDEKRNTILRLSGNFWTDFPKNLSGGIYITPSFTEDTLVDQRIKQDLIYYNDDPASLNISVDLDFPAIRIEGRKINILGALVNSSDVRDPTYVYSFEDNDENEDTCGLLTISNIRSSNKLSYIVGNNQQADEFQTVVWYSYSNRGGISSNQCSLTICTMQNIRIYSPVMVQEVPTSTTLTLKKSDMFEGNPVSGATYGLFEMKLDEAGSLLYQEGDSITVDKNGNAYNQDKELVAVRFDDVDYQTDEQGVFTLNTTLTPNYYCFIELVSPSGYELNTTPLVFEIGSAKVEIGGGDRLSNMTFVGSKNQNYQLYKWVKDDTASLDSYTNENGFWEILNREENVVYTTDETGKMYITGLSDGYYYLVNVEDSSDVIKWTINGGEQGENVIGNATITLESVICVDRYSSDVTISIELDNQNVQLQKVDLMWEAYNSSTNQVESHLETFETAQEVQDYINANKEIFGGPITIQPTMIQQVQLEAEDPQLVDFSFSKVDGSNDNAPLANAKFTLYSADVKADGTWQKNEEESTATSDASGLVSFADLQTGKYILEETKAPAGYEKLAGYWKVTVNAWTDIEADKLQIVYVKSDGTETAVPVDSNSQNYYIQNYQVETLPLLGSKGTIAMYTIGFMLVVSGLAISLYVQKRTMGN